MSKTLIAINRHTKEETHLVGGITITVKRRRYSGTRKQPGGVSHSWSATVDGKFVGGAGDLSAAISDLKLI